MHNCLLIIISVLKHFGSPCLTVPILYAFFYTFYSILKLTIKNRQRKMCTVYKSCIKVIKIFLIKNIRMRQ